MPPRKKKDEPGFEELLRQTEEAVEKLEAGDLPLEESLALYEQGVKNLRSCAALIEAAQQRVEQLLESGEDSLRLAPFEAEAPEDGEEDDAEEETGA